jgi:FkbM family methyltransferase
MRCRDIGLGHHNRSKWRPRIDNHIQRAFGNACLTDHDIIFNARQIVKLKEILMKRPFQETPLLIRTLISINRLEIEKSLKRKIMLTWFKVFFLKRYDSKNRIANILGFKLKFLSCLELSFLFREIFLDNEYYFVCGNDSPYIIDCGSNIGMSILYFKVLYPHSRIVAFEPGEETYSCLEENVKNNRLNSVALHKAALSSKEGTIELYYDQDNVSSLRTSTKKERMPKQRRTVEAMLLSKYIHEDVDFLKIDIEGSELEVIEELSNAKKLRYVKQMVIEYHHHIARESDVFSRMLMLLEDAGFGYQIESFLRRPFAREQFQDIMVYAYRKKSTA